MSLDLAPNHKTGLIVDNPILVAGGAVGYGDAIPKGMVPCRLGAVVVGPVMAHSRRGAEPPRLVHVPGGFLLETGLQNRGVRRVLERFRRSWSRLGCPVLVQLADDHPDALARVVTRLAEVPEVVGFEILLPRAAGVALIASLVGAVVQRSELPVWVKLPLASAVVLAPVAVEAGAVGLVVGQGVEGAGARTVEEKSMVVRGSLAGMAAFPLMLAGLIDVAALQLPAALLACGGIHTVDQVRLALASGARAVQIDSAIWVEPALPMRLLDEFAL